VNKRKEKTKQSKATLARSYLWAEPFDMVSPEQLAAYWHEEIRKFKGETNEVKRWNYTLTRLRVAWCFKVSERVHDKRQRIPKELAECLFHASMLLIRNID
jgi:hypothetical protein